MLAQSCGERPILRRFALRGNPLSGNCGCYRTVGAINNVYEDGQPSDTDTRFQGGAMDLAMAMSVALFGMFTGSTIYFFYKFTR